MKKTAKDKCKEDANSETNTEDETKDYKTNKEAEGKKQPTWESMTRQSTTLEQTAAANQRKDNWEKSKQKKRTLQDTALHDSCHAGTTGQVHRVDMYLEGDNINASKCKTCMQVCHNACLFQWNQNVYCINCYKMVVTKQYDAGITFEENFEE